jgi:alkanesulfonate monooxygenase SsuD/methylene tetrahydromethanopterin reductase-like flavin-dependent oxidoreductase (luciferase family)
LECRDDERTSAAGNYGTTPMDHATRYESAAEFVEVVKGLWDSWEEGAITTNVETGEYFDKTKVHSLDHVGKFYSVRGPLNLTRTPQGQPVLVQAGASDDGRNFASRFAEMIFVSQLDKEHAKDFYATMKAKVAEWGRNPEHCKILPGFMPIVGRNEEDARKKLSELMRLAVPEVALKMLSARFGHDMSKFDLMVRCRICRRQTKFKPTPKWPMKRPARRISHCVTFTIKWPWPAVTFLRAGTQPRSPMSSEEWFVDRACDGFIWCLPIFPPPLTSSLMQSCLSCKGAGVFRREYSGFTLREHLGLPVPTNRYSKRMP